MVVFPPSSSAIAKRMLSWKTRSLVVFMMRSITRSEAPSLSRWHCTSARLISPRLRPPCPPNPPKDRDEAMGQFRTGYIRHVALIFHSNLVYLGKFPANTWELQLEPFNSLLNHLEIITEKHYFALSKANYSSIKTYSEIKYLDFFSSLHQYSAL